MINSSYMPAQSGTNKCVIVKKKKKKRSGQKIKVAGDPTVNDEVPLSDKRNPCCLGRMPNEQHLFDHRKQINHIFCPTF